MPDGQDQQIAQMLWESMKTQAKEIAEMRGPAPGVKKLTPEEEQTLFWKMADGWTPDKEIALLQSGKSREEVGLLKFPHREKLAKSNGRALSKYEQAVYLANMAKKSDPAFTPPPNKYQEPAPPPGLMPPTESDAPPAALPETAGPLPLEGESYG